MTTQEKLAYMAGIIDGEGCISIARVKAPRKSGVIAYNYVIHLSVINTSFVLIEWLADNFGGTFRERKLYSLKHARTWQWELSGKGATKVMELIRPYLLIKTRQADLMISYRKVQDFSNKTRNKFTPGLRETVHSCMKGLNRRGPEPVETNTPEANQVLAKIESELQGNLERQLRERQSSYNKLLL